MRSVGDGGTRRWLTGAVVGAGIVMATVVGATRHAGASAAPPDTDPTALLERYAPTVALRTQSSPCGEGEPYRPITVDNVLGRDDVVLKDGDGDVLAPAPSAADLARGEGEWELDLPGDALSPGCSYEQWARSMAAVPTVYGRAVQDGDVLVAQYWLYYVYNDWNDRHESDWEMIQLLFDASTVRDAIEKGPFLYAYAQHEGAEYAYVDPSVELDGVSGTGDDKLHVIGDSPVVYPGQGSHAAYFSASRWFGKSGATGFGCDDTTTPLTQIEPEVVVLPADAPASGDFAWLSYEGHWGERRPLFNDGPTGPAMKTQWDEPVQWVVEEGRDAAVPIPFGTLGATDAFCDASQTASLWLIRALDNPVRFAVVAVLAVVAAVAVVRYASRGLLGAARRTYLARPGPLLAIGAALLAAELLALALHWLVTRSAPSDNSPDLLGEDSPWRLLVLSAITVAIVLPAAAWVLAATIELVAGRGRIGRGAARWWLPRVRMASFLTGLALLCGLALALSVFFPAAALVAAWWLVVPVACAAAGVGVREGMRRSATGLRGRRLRAISVLVLAAALVAVPALAGAVALVLVDIGFVAANTVTAALAVVVVPYVAIFVSLFHAELPEVGDETA